MEEKEVNGQEVVKEILTKKKKWKLQFKVLQRGSRRPYFPC